MLLAAPLHAHHAFSAEFDATRPVKLKGTVTRWELVNPHSWLHIDVKKRGRHCHQLDDRGWQPQCPAQARSHQNVPAARNRTRCGRLPV
ncbi:MAG: DUF6152 family protein [Acidobacteriota bacterium]